MSVHSNIWARCIKSYLSDPWSYTHSFPPFIVKRSPTFLCSSRSITSAELITTIPASYSLGTRSPKFPGCSHNSQFKGIYAVSQSIVTSFRIRTTNQKDPKRVGTVSKKLPSGSLGLMIVSRVTSASSPWFPDLCITPHRDMDPHRNITDLMRIMYAKVWYSILVECGL